MRRATIFADLFAIAVLVAGIVLLSKVTTDGAPHTARPVPSSLELMSTAKDLPTAPTPDAF